MCYTFDTLLISVPHGSITNLHIVCIIGLQGYESLDSINQDFWYFLSVF